MITDEAKGFARLRAHLHRGGRWFYLWTLEDKTTQWFSVGREPTLLRGRINVYFGVHPTNKPKSKSHRATNEEVSVINCLFADLDAKSFDGSKERARAHLQSITFAPSVIVDSGGGYHAYWLLREPFIIGSDADRRRAKTAQANWVALVGGDPGAKDLARVLRVPGTVNYKKEYAPNFPTVTIYQADWDRQYALKELEAAAHQVKAPKPVPSKRVPHPSGNGYSKYVDAAVAGELDKLARTSEGSRNTQLNASAFALGQLVGAGALDRPYVESQLWKVAQTTGLGEREAAATIRSGIDAGMKEPRPIPSAGNGHEASPHGDTLNSDPENAPTLEEQGGQYVIRDGRICRRKKTQDGVVLVPLCNFAAHITEEVTHDDGADVTRLITIEGSHAEGGTLAPAQVDATQFASMRWVAPSWGSRAIVEAGTSAQDHLRAAIQYLSSNIGTRHVFAHTGWREIAGKRVFLTQSGAIGGAPATVELEKEIERYALPTQTADAQNAMRESLRFLEIAPRRVTVPLWAAMYLAPLAEIISLRFMLWVYGATGVFKSALTAVALSHYGDFTQDDLVAWDTTSNSLGKYLFLAKDVPFVIDDFAPQTDQTSAHKFEQIAAQTVRHVGNRSGRGRLKSDLTQRTIYRPRGLVISTGEQLPNGQSLVGRLITVEVNKGDVNLARLSAGQDNRAVYPEAMAAYIGWLAPRWDQVQATLPSMWRELRTKARNENQHARLPESIASLYVGLDMGLQFAVHVGTLQETEAQALRDEGWTALCGVAERQHGFTEEQRPTRRYLTVIGELLAQGKARLNPTHTPTAAGDGEMLGWYDEDYLYLLPSASYHCVAKYEKDEGRIFGVKENALRRMLAEEGLSSVSDDKHLSDRVRIGGEQRRVLKIHKSEVEKTLGVSLQKVGKVDSDA